MDLTQTNFLTIALSGMSRVDQIQLGSQFRLGKNIYITKFPKTWFTSEIYFKLWKNHQSWNTSWRRTQKNKSHVHKWKCWKNLWNAEELLPKKTLHREKWLSLQLKIWESPVDLPMRSMGYNSGKAWKLMSAKR